MFCISFPHLPSNIKLMMRCHHIHIFLPLGTASKDVEQHGENPRTMLSHSTSSSLIKDSVKTWKQPMEKQCHVFLTKHSLGLIRVAEIAIDFSVDSSDCSMCHFPFCKKISSDYKGPENVRGRLDCQHIKVLWLKKSQTNWI